MSSGTRSEILKFNSRNAWSILKNGRYYEIVTRSSRQNDIETILQSASKAGYEAVLISMLLAPQPNQDLIKELIMHPKFDADALVEIYKKDLPERRVLSTLLTQEFASQLMEILVERKRFAEIRNSTSLPSKNNPFRTSLTSRVVDKIMVSAAKSGHFGVVKRLASLKIKENPFLKALTPSAANEIVQIAAEKDLNTIKDLATLKLSDNRFLAAVTPDMEGRAVEKALTTQNFDFIATLATLPSENNSFLAATTNAITPEVANKIMIDIAKAGDFGTIERLVSLPLVSKQKLLIGLQGL